MSLTLEYRSVRMLVDVGYKWLSISTSVWFTLPVNKAR